MTADTVEDYCKGYGELGDGGYAAGDMIDVYDLQGRPRCTIRATEVRVIRFGDIPEDVWRGETFSSAQEFRERAHPLPAASGFARRLRVRDAAFRIGGGRTRLRPASGNENARIDVENLYKQNYKFPSIICKYLININMNFLA